MPQDLTVIAIDGGSGVGKSSTARALAERLGFLYVDTGSHYRAVTLMLQRDKIPYTDEIGVTRSLAHWSLDADIIGNVAEIRIAHTSFDSVLLRMPAVNAEVSYYAAMPVVRKYLFHYQRSHAELALLNGFKGLVMEGRDIGLNIFPEAPFKYFFTADPMVKTQRRAKEGILDVTDRRDLIDSTKGQLHQSPGSVVVDTTHQSLMEVIEWLHKEIAAKLAKV